MDWCLGLFHQVPNLVDDLVRHEDVATEQPDHVLAELAAHLQAEEARIAPEVANEVEDRVLSRVAVRRVALRDSGPIAALQHLAARAHDGLSFLHAR